MKNKIKKGTQSDNDIWVLHRTKDIKALVKAVNSFVELLEADGYEFGILKESLKPFVKKNKHE